MFIRFKKMFKALPLKIASLIGKGEAWAEFQAAKSNLSNHAGIPRYPTGLTEDPSKLFEVSHLSTSLLPSSISIPSRKSLAKWLEDEFVQ